MTRGGPFVGAVCTATAILLGAEAAARWGLAAALGPHSYDTPRNPHFRRDWVGYTAPRPRPPGRRLVVVIGSSQGFLREERDGNLAFAPRLERLLAERGRDVEVANWSIPAANAPEMILLAARAAQHRPDVVVVSTGSRAFAADVADRPLSFWLSDATDLAYLPEVRRLLPDTFRERTAGDAAGWFAARTGLGRLRRRAVEPRRENWTWGGDEPAVWRRLSGERMDRRTTRLLLSELDAALRAGSPATRLLVVAMPLAQSGWRPAAWGRTGVVYAEAVDVFAEEPRAAAYDARLVVPSDEFTTATHLDPRGHERYAEWLLPRVDDALDAARPRG